MCTVTDPLATGLFIKKNFQPEEAYKPTEEELEYHRQWRDAILEQSRRTMAPIIARYLTI